MTTQFFPVVLAGGSGTRLWPLSRKNFPKQFLRLQGETSLLQQTVQRAITLPHAKTLVVSNEAHYFLCQEQLQAYNEKITYLLEPCARNTAPAIASAAHYIKSLAGRDAVMLILPSDHWIADDSAWHAAMMEGAEFAARAPALVTFGILRQQPLSMAMCWRLAVFVKNRMQPPHRHYSIAVIIIGTVACLFAVRGLILMN